MRGEAALARRRTDDKGEQAVALRAEDENLRPPGQRIVGRGQRRHFRCRLAAQIAAVDRQGDIEVVLRLDEQNDWREAPPLHLVARRRAGGQRRAVHLAGREEIARGGRGRRDHRRGLGRRRGRGWLIGRRLGRRWLVGRRLIGRRLSGCRGGNRRQGRFGGRGHHRGKDACRQRGGVADGRGQEQRLSCRRGWRWQRSVRRVGRPVAGGQPQQGQGEC